MPDSVLISSAFNELKEVFPNALSQQLSRSANLKVFDSYY